MGFPARSVTCTLGAVATLVFTVALCPSPVLTICFGFPCSAVAPNFRGEPTRPPTDADAESTPAAVPRTRVAVATPLPLVIDETVIEPPPAVTVHETVTPETPLLFVSVTCTL